MFDFVSKYPTGSALFAGLLVAIGYFAYQLCAFVADLAAHFRH